MARALKQSRDGSTRNAQQGWVLDTLLGLGGLDILHPESLATFEEYGYHHADLAMVSSMAKARSMLPWAWSEVASHVEQKARFYEEAGFNFTARDLYLRAAVLWGRAQYNFFADDPRKLSLRDRGLECAAAFARVSPSHVERIVLPFQGHHLFATVLFPDRRDTPSPLVILVPGMDMVKEDMYLLALRYFTCRGMAALAIDGPGQGESRSNGLKVGLTNYEEAVGALLDHLSTRPEIDSNHIGLWGVSMGSYWGMRCAAKEHRLGAVATALGCYGDMDRIFNRAQPNYKTNFMYMAGYDDEQAFDRELGTRMNLWDLGPEISCPVFMGIGEFDELTYLEDALTVFESIRAPKEIAVFGEEFHPLGGVVAEVFRFGAEWIERGLRGDFAAGRDGRRFMPRHGVVQRGDAKPPWWLASQRLEAREAPK